MWDSSLLPKQQAWWYSEDDAGGVSQQEWRPRGGTYLCAGEPADVFSRRMQQLKEWLVQRPEVTCDV